MQIFGPEEVKNKGGKTILVGMIDRGFTVYGKVTHTTSTR
jgi:hypothetical protein